MAGIWPVWGTVAWQSGEPRGFLQQAIHLGLAENLQSKGIPAAGRLAGEVVDAPGQPALCKVACLSDQSAAAMLLAEVGQSSWSSTTDNSSCSLARHSMVLTKLLP